MEQEQLQKLMTAYDVVEDIDDDIDDEIVMVCSDSVSSLWHKRDITKALCQNDDAVF